MKKIILILIALLIIAGAAYWYFFMKAGTGGVGGGIDTPGGFVPLDRPGGSFGGDPGTVEPGQPGGSVSTTTLPGTALKIPTLRLLSDTPVGGYGASTTGKINGPIASSTTVVRWVDRGRGNIYEALGNTLDIATLSNTVVPKIYESLWNKNLTGFIAFGITEDSDYDEGDDVLSGVYANLVKRVIPRVATTTSTTSPQTTSATTANTLTPYELKGKSLPENILTYAISPKKDKLFLLVNEGGSGAGYTMNFDGSSAVKIFTTPLTQVNVEWPTDTTLAITTKGAADSQGFLYFVDAKTGVWKKVLGPLPGLSTKTSTDAKRVFISAAGSANNIVSSIYNVTDGTGTDAVVRTLADKCVWGNFYKEMVYCAVPSQPIPGTYPDDWYIGTVSFVDKVWALNAATGEIKLISSIVDTSDRVVDVFNLGLDDRDDFLFFMNKNDLSLWSLDLVK